VDFVLRSGEVLLAIEAKAAALHLPTVSRGARSFIEAYRPAGMLVIHTGQDTDTEVAGVPVRLRGPEVLATGTGVSSSFDRVHAGRWRPGLGPREPG